MASTFDAPPDLTSFGHEIWWVILVKVVAVFLILVLMTLFTIVAERIVVARMQQRIGPNRVGPRGSLQSLADGVKLMLKEDIIPALVGQADLHPGADHLGGPGVPGVQRRPVRARRSRSAVTTPRCS